MPFRKAAGGDYVSPSGKHFTKKQVKLYYATEGFKKRPSSGVQRKPLPRSKSGK